MTTLIINKLKSKIKKIIFKMKAFQFSLLLGKTNQLSWQKHIKVPMTRIFLLSSSKELSKWWRMVFILLWQHSWLPSCSRFWFMQIGYVWRHKRYTKWCKIPKNWISVPRLNLQGWNFARLMYCNNYTFW